MPRTSAPGLHVAEGNTQAIYQRSSEQMEPLSTADKRKAGQVPKTTKNAVNIYICLFSFTADNGYWGEYRPASVSRCRLAAASFAFRLAPVLVCRMPLLTALSISWYASDISFSTGLMASSDDGRSVMKLSTAVITYMYTRLSTKAGMP